MTGLYDDFEGGITVTSSTATTSDAAVVDDGSTALSNPRISWDQLKAMHVPRFHR